MRRHIALGPPAWLLATALLGAWGGAATASDPVVLNADRYRVEAGRHSPFAAFQANLQRSLDDCGRSAPFVVAPGEAARGRIGTETRLGIQRALGCEAFKDVPADSPSRTGAITKAVWRAVMGDVPLPSVRDRTNAMILSFEATDFGDKPEWNFCQDSPRGRSGEFDPREPGAICYNASDPCSFLTWGPRGATAGQGREIQWTLWLAWTRDPALVERAFGREASSLKRFFTLKGNPQNRCEHGAPLERFMCAIWLDPARRRTWEAALTDLGRVPMVRQSYDEVYALEEFDGIKLQAFADLWRRLHLPVSEIDYAFFMDRITHLGGPPADDEAAEARSMRACMTEEHQALSRNAAARRCLGRLQPHATQPQYRRARDVAFYLDAYPDGALSKAEISDWAEYVPLSAAHNFALSDAAVVSVEPAASRKSLGSDLPMSSSSNLTPAERAACPKNVLFPVPRVPQR